MEIEQSQRFTIVAYRRDTNDRNGCYSFRGEFETRTTDDPEEAIDIIATFEASPCEYGQAEWDVTVFTPFRLEDPDDPEAYQVPDLPEGFHEAVETVTARKVQEHRDKFRAEQESVQRKEDERVAARERAQLAALRAKYPEG